MKRAALAVAASLAFSGAGWAADPAPLTLEAKIPLGEVRGRIDHLAVDVERMRLFVAELGNDSVGVVDVANRRVIRTIAGLSEPQGVGYVPATGTLYVANARDGSVRLFERAELAAAGRIDLGGDADNVRIDETAPAVVVGYGKGALAVIDPQSRGKIADIPLPAHPEGFVLDPAGGRAYVNLPDARQIAIVDRAAGRVVRTVATNDARANFPMALESAGLGFLAVFRNPPRLNAFAPDGARRASAETCGDADDVFVDAKRHRLYVSCGEGFIDVFDARQGGYARIARLATVPGARTSLFVPALDRLFLAVRAQGREPAAIWQFRAQP
jgi:YVTN family beta-propeller protein